MEPLESEGTLKGHLVRLSRNKQGHLQLGQAAQSPVQPDPSEPPGGAPAGRSPVPPRPPPSLPPFFPPSLRRCLPATELGMAGLAGVLCLAAAAACLLPAQGRESDAGWTQQKVGRVGPRRAAVVFRRLADLSFVPRPAAGGTAPRRARWAQVRGGGCSRSGYRRPGGREQLGAAAGAAAPGAPSDLTPLWRQRAALPEGIHVELAKRGWG